MTNLTPEELIRMQQRRAGMKHKRKREAGGASDSKKASSGIGSKGQSEAVDSDNETLGRRKKKLDTQGLSIGGREVVDVTGQSDPAHAVQDTQPGFVIVDSSRTASPQVDVDKIDDMTIDRRLAAAGKSDFPTFIRVVLAGPPWYTSTVAIKKFMDFSLSTLKNVESLRGVFFGAVQTLAEEKRDRVALAHSLGVIEGQREEAVEALRIAREELLSSKRLLERLESEKMSVCDELRSEKQFRDSQAAELAAREQELENARKELERAKSTGEGLNLYALMNTTIGQPVFKDMAKLAAADIKSSILAKYPDLDLSFLPADSEDETSDSTESIGEEEVNSKKGDELQRKEGNTPPRTPPAS